MTTTVTMHLGDVRDVTRRLIEQGDRYDLLVTSPPFLALRSYLPPDHPDKHREIGSEPTPAAFLDTLYGLTADWSQLLPEWASICVELGDTYSGSGGAGGDYQPGGWREGQPTYRKPYGDGWPLAKSMCLIPHGYTIGLAYGHNPLTGTPSPAGQWRVRNVICWARPNPPVGSLGKRDPHKRTGDAKFRPATSYITVACRGTGRYFDLDAVRGEISDYTKHYSENPFRGSDKALADSQHGPRSGGLAVARDLAGKCVKAQGTPPLDWHADDHPEDGDWLWRLPTQSYHGSHYATFPVALPRRMILAMCPQRVCTVCCWPSERVTKVEQASTGRSTNGSKPRDRAESFAGTTYATRTEARSTTLGWTDCGHDAWRTGRVLDPFGGSGTTAVAAALEHRDAVLIDLDERNVDLVDGRLRDTLHVLDMHRTGGTVTWTVDAPLPDQDDQVAGQLTLLDLEVTA